jgi:hypothetical protein
VFGQGTYLKPVFYDDKQSYILSARLRVHINHTGDGLHDSLQRNLRFMAHGETVKVGLGIPYSSEGLSKLFQV